VFVGPRHDTLVRLRGPAPQMLRQNGAGAGVPGRRFFPGKGFAAPGTRAPGQPGILRKHHLPSTVEQRHEARAPPGKAAPRCADAPLRSAER